MALSVQTIRRLALLGFVVMVVVVGGAYGLRRWEAYEARKAAPAPVPRDVAQQAEKFTFARTEKGHTVFTVDASRTTERTGQTTLLENVVVHLYGRSGERNDEVRTARCEYDAGGTGRILCPGEVRVLLRSSRSKIGSGERAAGGEGGSLELTTTALHFDPDTDRVWTDEPVNFRFSGGSGEAVGLRYEREEPRVRLLQKVTIHVTRREQEPVELRGAQLAYFASDRRFELQPPLAAAVGSRTLTARQLSMSLDPDFRMERIEATGAVEAGVRQDGRQLTLRTQRLVATYGPGETLQALRAEGQVEFTERDEHGNVQLTSTDAALRFAAGGRLVERISASGQARLVSQAPGERRELRAPAMELMLRADKAGGQELSTQGRGTLTLARPPQGPRTLEAEQLALHFAAGQKLESIEASGSVATREPLSDGTLRTTASDQLRARFDRQGELTEADQWGHFRYEDSRWIAEAGRAHSTQAANLIALTEGAAVSSAGSRTTAQTISIRQDAGLLEAQGKVRTTREPKGSAVGGLGSNEPVHLAAQSMRASRKEGWARYEGDARLWQGDNRLAADAIQVWQDPARLVAEGQVSCLFLESGAGDNQQNEPRAVRLRSDRFTYVEADRQGVFEGGVTAAGGFGTLTAPRVEVYLSAAGTGSGRVERVEATGGVEVEQAGWRASGQQGEYRADAQTVALWGGTPMIHDPQRGVTTGARLTLFLADDRLVVDSSEGTRTVTRRPWKQ